MDMHRYQQRMVAMAAQAWPDDATRTDMGDKLIARLCEETGELAQAVRRMGRTRWGHIGETEGGVEAVAEEIGDVLFLVARIAALAGTDLAVAAERSRAKMVDRMNLLAIPLPPDLPE